MANTELKQPEQEQSSHEYSGPPVDAGVRGYASKDNLQLTLLVSPPRNGGAHITLDALTEYLRQNQIIYGIDQEQLERIVRDRMYETPVLAAQGVEVVDGVDGRLIEYFPREVVPSFQERIDGTIDFKEMNLVTNIEEEEVICEIIAPVEGKPGMTIYGVTVNPRKGLEPIVPGGDNTRITEDGTALVAAVAGSLVFRKGKFCVDSVFVVEGNVDVSTGNIHFNGDVVVKGVVQEGYAVVSQGNVRVSGAVEGASITAGGSITLEKGINGMGHGTLNAGGDISSKYIESCTICAGGNITAESIINCTLEADGNVIVSGQQGRIVGGKLTVFGSIQAVNIGSRSAVSTVITLGQTPRLMREKDHLESSLKELHRQNEEMAKNLAYLERADRLGQLNTEEKRAKYNEIKLKTPMMAMREARMKQKRDQMEEELLRVRECTLRCKTFYPPARISIGNAVTVIQDMHQNCRIYRNSEGEISVGLA